MRDRLFHVLVAFSVIKSLFIPSSVQASSANYFASTGDITIYIFLFAGIAFVSAYLARRILRSRFKQAVKEMLVESAKGNPGSSDTYKEIKQHSDTSNSLTEKLLRTDSSERNRKARNLLSGHRMPRKTEILRLLRDNSTESKRYAVHIIGKFRLTDMAGEVCNCLGISSLETDVRSVLGTFGEKAAEDLIKFYMKSQGNVHSCRSALRILGSLGGTESSSFLFTRLWSSSRELSETAADALVATGFKPSDSGRESLNQLVSDIIGIITWDIAARITFAKNYDSYLPGIINSDIARWESFLFSLLSISCGYGPVGMIRSHLEEGSAGSLNLARGMIDNLVDTPLRQKVSAALGKASDREKIKKLRRFYPGELIPYDNLTEAIINRDYNHLDLWIKACTLRHMPEIRTPAMTESASALLFSPEEIIREESARLIARTNREQYWSVSERIADPLKRRLDRIVMGKTEQGELVFDKVVFLAQRLTGIPERRLMYLSGNMVLARKYGGTPLNEDCIIWPLSSNGHQAYVHYRHQSESILPDSQEPCYFLSLSSLDEFRNHFPDHSGEIVSYIGRYSENRSNNLHDK